MSLPLKAGLTAITIGSIGGATYLGSTYFSRNKEIVDQKQEEKGKSINALIKEEFKYVLLDTETKGDPKLDAFWKANWDNYNAQNTDSEEGKDPLKLTGWTKENKNDLTEELKKESQKLFDNTVLNNTDPTYQNVEKYCTRGVTVEEDAKNKKITVLNTLVTGDDSKIWEKREQDKATLKANLEKIGINQKGDQLTKNVISKGCETAKSRNKKENDYDAIYQAYEKVCTKQNDDPK